MSETENIIPNAIQGSDLRGDSSLPSGSDLEGSALPTDTTVGRSDPIVAHKKFPLFSVILLIILSVVSVISVYLFLQVRELSLSQPVPSPSPTPAASTDPTEGWVTYTNEKYKFSFSYPQSMNSVTENEDFANGDFKGIVIVQNFPRTNTPNYSENATFQMLIYAKKDDGNIKDQKELTPYGGDGATIAKVINGYVYHINFTRNKTGNAKLPDQILSTFKFTSSSTSYTCPISGYADCMPSPDGPKPSCTKEAMDWYKANCPDFKGGAL